MTETDALTRLLSRADPRPADADERAVLDRTWVRLEAELAASTVVPLRRRRVRAVIAGTAALAVLCGGTAVAAELLKARTGLADTPSTQTEEFAPGELIDLAAPDLADAIFEMTRDVPFPSEAARRHVIYDNLDFDPRTYAGPEKTVSSSAVERATVARLAVCAWSRDFAEADAVGDSNRRAADAAALAASPSWRAFSLVDGPGELNEATSGIRDDWYIKNAQAIADAAATGSAAAVHAAAWGSGWCYDPLPLADVPMPRGPASPASTATEPATTATERPASTTAPQPARTSQPAKG